MCKPNVVALSTFLQETRFPSLKVLILDNTLVSDKVLVHLFQNKSILNLEKISVRNCRKITDKSLDLVLNLKSSKLIEVDIGENRGLAFDVKHILFCPQILNIT